MQTIGIIGGKGLMGKFFADFFKKSGFKVLVSDVNTKLTNAHLVQKSDIVFFSVPIHLTEKIIKSVINLTRPDQLLLDCTSLKIMPVRAMLKSKSQVIGLHPMFRPSPTGFKNQTVIMCPMRAKKETAVMVKKLFTNAGAKIIKMTPSEHDKLMSLMQTLVHFHAIVMGNTFKKLRTPIAKTLRIASPIYRLEMDMIGRIFSQNPELYAAIEMLNPKSAHVTKMLEVETKKLAQIIRKKDFEGFKKSFMETARFLGSFKQRALKETNKLYVVSRISGTP